MVAVPAVLVLENSVVSLLVMVALPAVAAFKNCSVASLSIVEFAAVLVSWKVKMPLGLVMLALPALLLLWKVMNWLISVGANDELLTMPAPVKSIGTTPP